MTMKPGFCDECLRVIPHHSLYRPGLCILCAKETGEFTRQGNVEEYERFEMERRRVAEENEAQIEFDKAQEAKKEMAARELCRRKLLPFIKRSNPDYMPGWVHADICARLEAFAQAVERGESPRLMITMPPRHGKSEIGSKTFPTWYLGRNPKHEIIITSYSGDLAEDFSRKCRALMESDGFTTVFDTRLSDDSTSVKKWATAQGGGFTAAGVGGPITGRGAHIGIVDDPVKNREEAESDVTRQKVKDWYSSTFYTRLAPGGGILIIQTRWHDDDLAGWLLNTFNEAKAEAEANGTPIPDDVDQWEVVEYPAIAIDDEKFRKKGEALHPQRYPLEALLRIKRAMLPRDWEALYQQRPVSADGDYFKAEMFRYYKPGEAPPLNELRMFAACDLAVSTKQTADYTVIAVVGVDRQGNIWVIDIIRGRWNSLGIIERLFEVRLKYNPEIIGIETGQIELTLEPFILKAVEERGIPLPYEKLKTRGMDKGTRARSIQGRMEQGRVYFPTVESTPWMGAVKNEMLKFPLAANDDIVDALAWIGHMLLWLTGLSPEKVEKKPSFLDKYRKQVRNRRRSMTAMSA